MDNHFAKALCRYGRELFTLFFCLKQAKLGVKYESKRKIYLKNKKTTKIFLERGKKLLTKGKRCGKISRLSVRDGMDIDK